MDLFTYGTQAKLPLRLLSSPTGRKEINHSPLSSVLFKVYFSPNRKGGEGNFEDSLYISQSKPSMHKKNRYLYINDEFTLTFHLFLSLLLNISTFDISGRIFIPVYPYGHPNSGTQK